MSIENTLERIANNLGRVADTLDRLAAGENVEVTNTGDTPSVVDTDKPKPSKKKRSKKADAPAPASTQSEAYPTPTTIDELIAMMTEFTKGLAPEKMIELSRIMREDFKVSKLHDLPEDDYANFAEALQELVQS